jgi:sulfate transport system permease protein
VADLAVGPPTTAPRTPAPHGRAYGIGRRRPGALGLRAVAVAYVGLLVLIPVIVIFYRAFEPGVTTFFDQLRDPETQHAFKVTAIVAGSAVVINTVFGVAAGVLLARYRFPGKRLLSAFIDLPVAVSPIVVGLALLLVFGPSGWFGPFLDDHGVPVIGAKPGMVLATAFVSLPLVVRAVVPVLEQVGTEQEQAAASLGANAFTRFHRITLPTIRVALTYGIVLSIARCIGEYGAVLVVSNNIEGETETATLRISNQVESAQNYPAAYAITIVLILVSFAAILAAAWIRRRRAS